MPKRKRYYQDEIHKNVTRERFIRSFHLAAVEKLREALEASKKKGERHE